jgi:hypothetical protein
MSEVAGRRLVRRRDDGFELRLRAPERRVLGGMLIELRTLLIAENPASDPAVARLFPPAYPDDLLQNLDYERTAGSGLLAGRLEDVDRAEASLDAARLSEDELTALMRVVNDLRLIYGTRLDVTEVTARSDLPDEQDRATFDVYMWLGWFIQDTVEALAGA